MAKHTIFKGGLIDWFLMSMGAFPVNRDLADRTALRICEELLDAGEAVVMFPEGRRKEGDTVEDLFRGPAFVAARQRVPIVPIGIGGSDAAMPIGKKLIYPRKIVCVIGEPLYPDVELEGRVSRDQVNELLERLRVDLERLYADAKALL
jgi:1-acyl-sn-glycerol-3-phosphate acyltransferase